MLGGNVMPRKRVRAKREPWMCRCWAGAAFKRQPAAVKRCLECLEKRP